MSYSYVYILKSCTQNFTYIGSTDNLERRLKEHNEGLSQSTKAYRPFQIEAFIAVSSEWKARELENILKPDLGKLSSNLS